MLAATQGVDSDRYWLVHVDGLKSELISPLETTMLGTCNTSFTSDASYDELLALAKYSSGFITLRANASYLDNLSIRKVLPHILPFVPSYQLPNLSFEFQPAKLPHDLKPGSMSTTWTQDRLKLDHSEIAKEKWIHQTISITFSGLHPGTQKAIIVAKGRLNAAVDVLRYIKACTSERTIKLHPSTGDFSLTLMSSVGKPVIDQLLNHLSQLETLLACVTIIKNHTPLSIQSISPFHTEFLYGKSPPTDLGLVIRFATSTSSLELEFTPQDSNPHARIATQLKRHLAKRSSALNSNLSTFIPLLACSLPLLTLFDELQSKQALSSPKYTAAAPQVLPTVHILVRDPKMYGIQYFGPSSLADLGSAAVDAPSTMLARFEILLSPHKTGVIWILRPAIEEYESYTRKSYCSQELKDRLRTDIFGRRDPEQGWHGLDTGASCPVDQPEKLLRRVDEVIRAWVREASEKGPKNTHYLNGGDGGTAGKALAKNEQNVQNRVQSQAIRTGSNNQQKTRTSAVVNGKANDVATGGKMISPRSKEVITLD